MSKVWDECLDRVRHEVTEEEFNAWIRPLQAVEQGDSIDLFAPNSLILEHIKEHHLSLIQSSLPFRNDMMMELAIYVGGDAARVDESRAFSGPDIDLPVEHFENNLNPYFTFDNFVLGKTTQLAEAASRQVASNPGHGYNPLFIYGATGLGKTHLMHAIGHQLLKDSPSSRILYIRSQNFVNDMVNAIQHKTINKFQKYFHGLDVLLIDDIQFFAGKDHSQEEFFNTYNILLESGKQIILTSDKFPKEIDNLEDRLKSRFGSGLTVQVEPPELETRVAILMNKAEKIPLDLPQDAAFEIAKLVKSNVRELEGALNNIRANSQLTGEPITVDSVRSALRELIAVHSRLISIDNIQKIISEYYNISLSDLLSRSRSRSIVRPRQIAMSLAKKLTEKSLPEIGKAFGGKDHTTVIHANRKVAELLESDPKINDDYKSLLKKLTV
ncbi:MAG: chromosomal replication initiator protein DnaA [Thiotrichales bacterium]|nr:chromosomal replication initiator protein DnaA [Thiotrichales bacterium]MBT3614242.1 chromosomal replication initiator protein DnaA [Thiotrichales bacterium]MBT3751894.1 chromosomal replication initiator protein DnaA [Thiotrichales bacterium]MBT3837152.1 chromosomal replication initiator protein DnaA [Thiotrichales bacterium]MBT4153008.1 chromosomal replication initiator protein DnaA [Thiotrichales bacterium]